MKSENYITIQGWMRTELNLKGNDLIVYAIIYGFSQTDSQRFTGSLQYLADWCGSTKQGIQKNLKNLINMGLIQKYDIVKNNVKFCEYSCIVCNLVSQGMQLSCMNNIDNNIDKKVFISKDINTTKVGNKNDFIGSAKSQPKQSLYSKCIACINDFTENKDIREDLIVFLNSLTEMKKLRGLTQFKGIINKLQGKSEAEQLKIIDYSIEHGYATFYELTNNSQYSRGRKIQETGNTHVESFTDEDEKHLREFQAKLRKEGKPVVF